MHVRLLPHVPVLLPTHPAFTEFNTIHSVTDALKQGWGAGLSPEYVMFRAGRGMRSTVHAYLLRPEAVEAFFVLWRLTGNVRYREYGWGVFQAIQKWCKVSGSTAAPALLLLYACQCVCSLLRSYRQSSTAAPALLLFSACQCLCSHLCSYAATVSAAVRCIIHICGAELML